MSTTFERRHEKPDLANPGGLPNKVSPGAFETLRIPLKLIP